MGKSQLERLWLIGGALGAAVVLLIGYTFFVGPQRSETDDVSARAASAQLQNSTLQARIDTLRTQNADLGKFQADVKAAQRALPSSSGLSDFLRSLQAIGAATQTSVQSLTVGPPTDLSAAAAPAPSSPSTAGGSASTPATTPGAVPAAGPQVFGLTISATVNGSTTGLNRFLDQLQSVQPRAVLITAMTQSAATSGSVAGAQSGVGLQLTMQAFVAPSSAAENAQLQQAAQK